MLAAIPTRHESSAGGYRRESFELWIQQNGCNTRQDVLIKERRHGATAGCKVQRGTWHSAYDGKVLRNASELDIDHVVPLQQAYVSGASRWNYATRRRYANDLGYKGSLRAVSAASNRSKGASDPAQWLPPRRAFRCKYIGTWIAVKYRWRLSADASEKRVLRHWASTCGARAKVARPSRATVRRKRAVRRHGHKVKPRSGRLDHRYATCKTAIGHGVGPYKRGRDPEYGWYRDADNDGLVCER